MLASKQPGSQNHMSKYDPRYDACDLLSEERDRLAAEERAEADHELIVAWEMATDDDGAPLTVTPLIAAQRWAAALGLQAAA